MKKASPAIDQLSLHLGPAPGDYMSNGQTYGVVTKIVTEPIYRWNPEYTVTRPYIKTLGLSGLRGAFEKALLEKRGIFREPFTPTEGPMLNLQWVPWDGNGIQGGTPKVEVFREATIQWLKAEYESQEIVREYGWYAVKPELSQRRLETRKRLDELIKSPPDVIPPVTFKTAVS